MKITKYPSQKGDITFVEITNAEGNSVVLSSLGAGIVEVVTPDRNGKKENIALRYADATDYYYDGPCLGKTPGRYANRIAVGRFSLNGKEYELPINNGPNSLHGGPEGFQNQIWDVELLENGVKFTYVSADGEQGYPGKLTATAEYHWSDDNKLTLTYKAETEEDTVVNLTNHAYWNLDGADAGSVLEHTMKINSSGWLMSDNTLIPSGEIAAVEGTPMDFREFKALGKDIKEDFVALNNGKGYDNTWVIEGWEPGKMVQAVLELESAKSGRTLKVSTDQPGAHVYTGNWLAGSPANCAGRSYEDYDGVAIEMQDFPDAPNKPTFPCTVLRKGEVYERHIVFAFGVK